MNFATIAFVDVFELGLSLMRTVKGDTVPRLGLAQNNIHMPSWRELAAVEKKLLAIANRHLVAAEMGRRWVEVTYSGEMFEWGEPPGPRPYLPPWIVVHLPIRTNPQAAMIAGAEIACPGVGFVTVVNAAVPNCSINLGDTPRIHLVAEFRKAELPVAREFGNG